MAATAEEAQFRSRCANDISFRTPAQEHDRQAWEVVARTVVVSSKRFELMKVQRVRRKAQHARQPARGHVLVEHRSLAREEDAEVCFSHEHEHAGEESTH